MKHYNKLFKVIPLLLLTFSAKAQIERAISLKHNVVSITTNHEQEGFGFITSERNGKLYIVTAAHLVENKNELPPKLTVKFYDHYIAKTVKLLDTLTPNLNLALLEVYKPLNYIWERNCYSTAQPGDSITFIGKERYWYVATGRSSGIIDQIDNDILNININSVKESSAGAPIINKYGIIGMIIDQEKGSAQALSIRKIKSSLNNRSSAWFSLKGKNLPVREIPLDKEEDEKELSAFQAAKDKGTIEAYLNYLKEFPEGNYRKEAERGISRQEKATNEELEKLAWEVAKTKNSTKGYKKYLESFPEGSNAKKATNKILEISNSSKNNVESVSWKKLRKVDGGSFLMGCKAEQGKDCPPFEQPIHAVSIPDFIISKFEVTNNDYLQFLQAVEKELVFSDQSISYYGFPILKLPENKKISYQSNQFSVEKELGNQPVSSVTWFGAIFFCNWLSIADGLLPFYSIKEDKVKFNNKSTGYRLPSEAEWEFAAGKADDIKSDTSKNIDTNKSEKVGWQNLNYQNEIPINEKKDDFNLGILGKKGNVYEWTNDCLNDNYEKAPYNGDSWGSGDCTQRIIRGGSFENSKLKNRVSARAWAKADQFNSSFGFRLAKSL